MPRQADPVTAMTRAGGVAAGVRPPIFDDVPARVTLTWRTVARWPVYGSRLVRRYAARSEVIQVSSADVVGYPCAVCSADRTFPSWVRRTISAIGADPVRSYRRRLRLDTPGFGSV